MKITNFKQVKIFKLIKLFTSKPVIFKHTKLTKLVTLFTQPIKQLN